MDKKLNFPQFIIGGAPKCGTSSLYFWLAAHPEIYGSPVKEPFFFADEVNRFNKGCNFIENSLEDYAKHFANVQPGIKSFESTAHYLYYQNAIDGLQQLPETPKVIFLLREPSAQLISHYNMERYRTQSVDCDLKDYIQRPYVKMYSEYTKYLQKWLEEYPADKVKVVLFEDMMSHKKTVIQDIAMFLGIDKDFYINFDWEHRNKTVKIKSSKLHQFGLRMQRLIPHSVQKVLLPIYLGLNSGDVPKINAADKKLLADFKTSKVGEKEALQKTFPTLDFSVWD